MMLVNLVEVEFSAVVKSMLVSRGRSNVIMNCSKWKELFEDRVVLTYTSAAGQLCSRNY